MNEIDEALDMIINTIRTYYTGNGSRNDGLDLAIGVIEDYKEWKAEGGEQYDSKSIRRENII